jgi:arylformamidase
MHTYDISLIIYPELPIYPGDPDIVLERLAKMEDGASCNISRLSMGVHTGTHVDAPYHFLGGDTATVEKLPLNLLIGRAYVLKLSDNVDLVTAAELQKADIPPRTRRLLIKTRNSRLWSHKEKNFQTGFVALDHDAAQYLVDRGIRLVGIDYLSIGPFHQGEATHKVLLQAGVVILEGLNLSDVSQGRYTLYCLPLKLAGSDGAPARAILIGA